MGGGGFFLFLPLSLPPRRKCENERERRGRREAFDLNGGRLSRGTQRNLRGGRGRGEEKICSKQLNQKPSDALAFFASDLTFFSSLFAGKSGQRHFCVGVIAAFSNGKSGILVQWYALIVLTLLFRYEKRAEGAKISPQRSLFRRTPQRV